ncbi:hypothetical protein, variant [Aphanomyces invadans]|nr:hypothetical protein, variant [Aphanomyces invadans]ETV99783.1 hypothetical protein, variant [Aphanomyces invadans]|eukprot:XP_008871559.1 hypothetical protein, variant [Aphanomyces invadans]
MLKAKLVQQREDEADIYYYLHKKLDANYEVIAQLESDIQTVKQERDAMDVAFRLKQHETEEAFAKEKRELTERVEGAEDTLHALEVFRERKIALEDKIAAMESTLVAEKENHRKQLVDMERRNVQEKERIKKDMLMKIKENKQNLLARTEDQLDTTTKRTMMENDQMISELQYQSKETEKLLAKYKALETEVVHLRLQLKVNKETEVEMAKRTHFYQKLIKKLNERVQSDQLAARTHAALAQGEERSKADVNKANEEMIALLETKSNALEAQLRTLCAELNDARSQLDDARTEKHDMLAQQDDTLRFLSVAIHDITHQLALRGHDEKGLSSLQVWQAGDIIPARLDDLAPSEVKKVLQMLFGKLHAYQASIVQTRPVLHDPTASSLQQVLVSPATDKKTSTCTYGVELPPLQPGKQRQDQLEILKALATRGDSVERATRPGNAANAVFESPTGVHLRSIAVQTLPEWSADNKRKTTAASTHRSISTLYHHVDRTKRHHRRRPRDVLHGDEGSHDSQGGGDAASPGLMGMTAAGRMEAGPPVLMSKASRPTVKTRIVLPDAHRLPLPSSASPG